MANYLAPRHATMFLLLLFCVWIGEVRGHGRLIEPPSRSSMWRYGFNTTANYNDHELYCGGFTRQQKNGGKCGVCGDAYDAPEPRPNEAGGTYGQGIIVRKYRQNSIIRIKIELTANHKGAFEFRLCPHNNPKKVVSQKCLDKYLLEQANHEGPRYYPGEGSKVFEARYLLPKGLTCTQCVIQWRYIAGNNWGKCPNGTEGVGCGPQEEFRACSDVSVYDSSGKASADEDVTTEEEEDDNVIDTDKLNDNEPSSDDLDGDRTDSVVWPLIMALIALLIATLFFGSLIGWFYRKEVAQFFRDTFGKPSWKARSHQTNLGYPGSRAPLPPPRSKKGGPDLHQFNVRHLTPDVISEPMQVTINGLAV